MRICSLREFIKKRLYHAGISKIEIERMANKAKINIHTARPGIVIGKKGAEIEKLKSRYPEIDEGQRSLSSIFMRSGGPTSIRNWWRKTSRCNWSGASRFAAR